MEDRYLEKNLEDVIFHESERFLLELGTGFCITVRQKRIQIDHCDCCMIRG